MENSGTKIIVAGIDGGEHSIYALSWLLDHFFVPFPGHPFKLVIVHARPGPSSVLGFAGPGSLDIVPTVDSDLKMTAEKVVDKAKEVCRSKGVTKDVTVEVMEGDARNVLCDVVDKHHASMLVVGSHNYGVVKRAALGSVSDHCAHNAHCSVLIVKKPEQ